MWPFKRNPPPMTELQRLEYYASQGDAASQLRLGMKYVDPERITPDDAKGLTLIQAAAEQGAAIASDTLATILLGRRDFAAGMKWLQVAAEQGLANAQARLGIFYSMDTVVPHDDIKAGAWMTIAFANGAPGGDEYLQKLMSRLNPSQKTEVQKLAAELMARLPRIPFRDHAERVGLM